MEERIMQFVKALRVSGVPVSMAETMDAARAVTYIGIRDRNVFRLTLRTAMIKRAQDVPVFEELFPLFFDGMEGRPLDMHNLMEDMTVAEARMLTQALRQLRADLAAGLKRLLRGEILTPTQLQQLAALTGLQQVRNLPDRDWMVHRMQRALQHDNVRQAMQELSALLAQMGFSKERLAQMREMLQANMEAETAQLDQFAGQRIRDNMLEQSPAVNVDTLMNVPFGYLDEADMNVLRREVRRLATILRSRIALRQKREKSGTLDLKATLRTNLKYGSVPFRLTYRQRRKQPKLVVICDISTSMRYCSELMLGLIHAIQDQIAKTHAFAFNDHLEFITPDLGTGTAQEAIQTVLIRMPPGHYSTDLGGSLQEFAQHYFDMVDARTTLLMVGDSRNNYRDPAAPIFADMARRSHRTIWLNPEPPMLWGTGDSDMQVYAPHCDHVLQVQTMTELTAAVDELWSQPAR